MLSQALYRWGRLAARHPWQVIGAWVLLVVVVLAASSAVGKKLEDSFAVPGTDSQQATELLTTTASARAGLTMQLVLTPKDAGATLTSPDAAAALAAVRAGAAALPHVVSAGAADTVAGRQGRGDRGAVPRRRAARPLGPAADGGVRRHGRRGLAAAGRDARGPVLRVRGGGDGDRRGPRPGGGDRHPARGLRLGRRDGTADRHGGPRARPRDRIAVPDRLPGRDPQLGARAGQHGGSRGRDRLRAVRRDPAPGVPRARAGGRGGGRAGVGHRRARPWSSPAAPWSSPSSAWPSPASRS